MDPVARLEPIPHPPDHLLVGNLFDLDASHPIESLMNLARKYGPIYELELPGRGSRVIVSGYKLVDELCDESRFDKMLGSGASRHDAAHAGHDRALRLQLPVQLPIPRHATPLCGRHAGRPRGSAGTRKGAAHPA